MNKAVMLVALGIASMPLSFAQAGAPGGGSASAPATQSRGSENGNKAGKAAPPKVTTDDSVYDSGNKPASGPATQNGKAKKPGQNNTKPQSPPNPPVVDPHEDPTSPVNVPKTGNVPK